MSQTEYTPEQLRIIADGYHSKIPECCIQQIQAVGDSL